MLFILNYIIILYIYILQEPININIVNNLKLKYYIYIYISWKLGLWTSHFCGRATYCRHRCWSHTMSLRLAHTIPNTLNG